MLPFELTGLGLRRAQLRATLSVGCKLPASFACMCVRVSRETTRLACLQFAFAWISNVRTSAVSLDSSWSTRASGILGGSGFGRPDCFHSPSLCRASRYGFGGQRLRKVGMIPPPAPLQTLLVKFSRSRRNCPSMLDQGNQRLLCLMEAPDVSRETADSAVGARRA